MDTKACTITEEEVQTLIWSHIRDCGERDLDMRLDRIIYLNKRLKAFKEEGTPVPEPVNPQPEPAKTGW